MQVLPDGTGDLVAFNLSQLPISQRWLCTTRADGQDKLGLALPGTAGTEGYIAEKEKGHVQKIQPGKSWQTTVISGLLNKEETAKMENKIAEINKKNGIAD